MKLSELLVGKRVRATKDCIGTEKGKIYKIEITQNSNLVIGNGCGCVETFEILDSITFKPKPHKHTLKCETCGEEVRK